MAPVAPHFGDFVIGTPAAFENTIAALSSGSTSIGNLGQYFAFRQPHWDDDIFTTAESLKAIALTAAQPVPVIVHSSLDDGFASMFTDLACSLGAILLEQYIVDDLLRRPQLLFLWQHLCAALPAPCFPARRAEDDPHARAP